MSVAFTTPTGEVLQSLAFWNEIQLAYSERRQAIGQSAAAAFAEDAYWQSLAMFQGWQNWIEDNCVSFENVGWPWSIPYTLETFRTAAGLNSDGFSRYDMSGNLLGYGVAQENDAIVANTILEIQNAFSTLYTSLTELSTIFPEIQTGEPRGCGYEEKSYYPDYDATPKYLTQNAPVSGSIFSARWTVTSDSTQSDDYLEINGVKFNEKSQVWYWDEGCGEDGPFGARGYNSDISFGSFSDGDTVPINVWDTLRYAIGAYRYIRIKWDFTNINP